MPIKLVLTPPLLEPPPAAPIPHWFCGHPVFLKAIPELIEEHGSSRLFPVYQENGVYNFYLKVKEPRGD